MLKKTIVFCVTFVLFINNFSVSVSAYKNTVSISASSAIVMNAVSKEVLYCKNAEEKRGIASTTKIMTSLLALENAELSSVVTAKKEDVMIEGTSVGIKPNEKLTVEDLLYAMLLESGNDAANVTATFVGKTRENFCKMMNSRAKELGMKNTNFANPSGLPDSNHYSTAYDMALLASFAIMNTGFRKICSTQKAVREYGEPCVSHYFTNHNRLLREYEGCIGLKTGYTKSSGRCLVCAAEKNGITLVCVTLNDPNDWQDHKTLLDYGFSNSKKTAVDINVKDMKLSVVGSNTKKISLYYNKTDLPFSKYSEYKIYAERFVYAPVKKGEKIGKIVYFNDSKEIIYSVDLLSANTVKFKKIIKKESKIQKIFKYIKDLF